MTNQVPPSTRLAGIVTAAELTAAGVHPGQIRRLIRGKVLAPLTRGVYAPAELAARQASDPAGAHLLQAAAVLARLGPGNAASHQTAAVAHGLDLLGRRPDRVHVTSAPDGTGSRATRPGFHLHVASLPGSHVEPRQGMLVTSVARTVIDLARTSPFQAGVVTADSALRSKLASKQDLLSALAACVSWPGTQRARQVTLFSDARSESALESVSRVAFRDQGLPTPDLQVWVGDDEVIGRVDFLWPQHRTIAEADGLIKYSGPARALAQLQRDARLRDAGFEVVHFTWQEITRVPWQVTTQIRRAFARTAK